jgi:hypothetical protein
MEEIGFDGKSEERDYWDIETHVNTDMMRADVEVG